MRFELQAESAECGLACLTSICQHYGIKHSIASLRRRFGSSLRGANLETLISMAGQLGFGARALRLEVEDLVDLKTPCIIHWNLNHFVVLLSANRFHIKIFDPAIGYQTVSIKKIGKHFTGIALELDVVDQYKEPVEARKISLRQFTGRILGAKRSIAQILIVAFVLEMIAIILPLFNQIVIDDAMATGDVELLNIVLLGFAILLLTKTVIGAFRSWMLTILSQTVTIQWMANVFEHLLKLPLSYFENRKLGEISSRFESIDAIQRLFTSSAIEAVIDGGMAITLLVIMTLYSPQLTLVVVAAVILYGALRYLSYRPFRDASSERIVCYARETSHFIETLRCIAPLKLLGREPERLSRWRNLAVDVQNRDARTARMNIGFAAANTLIFGIENLLIIWLGARQIIDGAVQQSDLTIGMLFAFIAYKTQFSARISTLINFSVDLKMLDLHSERLADIVLEHPETSCIGSAAVDSLEPVIELKNIHFRYSAEDKWILEGVSCSIAASETIAITGASGSGKTTLLKLILGMLKPTSGEIYYGGVPLDNLDIRDVRKRIGTVMQDDFLILGSISENVLFYDPIHDQSFLELCCKIAMIHDDIENWPMGYQTEIGELGVGLSGGQKQRLLLARALYRRPIWLALDEATSHLDAENERAIDEELARLKVGKILIAHRQETISRAQRILVLKEGKLCEGAEFVNSFEVLNS